VAGGKEKWYEISLCILAGICRGRNRLYLPETWSAADQSDRKTGISQSATPKGLLEEMEKYAIGDVDNGELNLSSLAMDENNSRMAACIFRKYKPQFLSIHIAGVDGAEHKEGHSGAGVNKAVAAADHALMNLMDAIAKPGLKDSTTTIITGDHGFLDVSKLLSPNVWLTEMGIDSKVGETEPLAKFQSAIGSSFFHLRDNKDLKTLAKVRKKLDELP
jgi:predicted AlkP superfamily pyrophosphatase or phosphodiesterase